MDVLASHPALLARMVRTSTGHASQQRAAELLAEAHSTDREAVIEIGRAAMASRNAPVDDYERSLRLMLGHGDWSSPAHHVTAVDCYTGERVVIDHRAASRSPPPAPRARRCRESTDRCGSAIAIAWTVASERRVHTRISSPGPNAL